MTNEEAAILAKEGDADAILFLWENNQGLIRIKLAGIRHDNDDFDDLLQDAFFSLRTAVKNFDPGMGFKFTTLLGKTIVWKVIRKRQLEKPIGDLCLDAPKTEDSDIDRIDQEEDKNAIDPAEAVVSTELNEILTTAIDKLPGREPECIRRHFFQNQQQTDIAERYGISSQAVHKSIRTALKRLRRDRAIRHMADDYLDAYRNTGMSSFRERQYTSSTELLALIRVEIQERADRAKMMSARFREARLSMENKA